MKLAKQLHVSVARLYDLLARDAVDHVPRKNEPCGAAVHGRGEELSDRLAEVLRLRLFGLVVQVELELAVLTPLAVDGHVGVARGANLLPPPPLLLLERGAAGASLSRARFPDCARGGACLGRRGRRLHAAAPRLGHY